MDVKSFFTPSGAEPVVHNVIRNTYKYQNTVTLSTILRICEALDCGPGDLMTAGKVECIPAKKETPDAW